MTSDDFSISAAVPGNRCSFSLKLAWQLALGSVVQHRLSIRLEMNGNDWEMFDDFDASCYQNSRGFGCKHLQTKTYHQR